MTTVLVLAAETTVDSAEVARIVAAFRGSPAGDSVWTFDGPQRAIRCGHALANAWAAADAIARVGVHTGEVRRDGWRLTGEGVETASAVAQAAAPGEVRISPVVRDLVHGAPLEFGDPAEVDLANGRTLVTLVCISPETNTQRR